MYVIGSFSFQLTLLKPILSDNYDHLKRQGAIEIELCDSKPHSFSLLAIHYHVGHNKVIRWDVIEAQMYHWPWVITRGNS